MTNCTGKLYSKSLAVLVMITFSLWITFPQYLLALPSNPTVESGEVTFENPNETTLVINASDQAIINFDSFSIAQNELVQFIQPNEMSSVLSRVLGSSSSDIFGSLFANGQLILVNPNGIHFGANANIEVGSLIASTLNIQSQLFLDNQFTFEQLETQNIASILNEADIAVRNGGHLVFLSETIENQGTMTANMGTVALGVGEKITVSLDAGGMINLVVDRGVSHQIQNGQPLIDNPGTLTADGGKITLNAKTLTDVFDTLINNEGVMQADRAVMVNGEVQFIPNLHDTEFTQEQIDQGFGGKIEMVSNGGVENSGIIRSALVTEEGYTFHSTGTLTGGDLFLKNLDGAGTISGIVATNVFDTDNLIVNGDITLAASVILGADSDDNGIGIFTMQTGTQIIGAGFDLELQSADTPFTPDANLMGMTSPQLRALTGIGTLTLSRSVTGETPVFTMNSAFTNVAGIAGLSIGTGAVFSLNGNNFDLTTAAAVSNDGTFRLQGSETIGANVTNLDINSGTVEFVGNNTAGPFTIPDFGATDYFNLSINDVNATPATYNAPASLTTANNLTISGGTLSAGTSTITIGDDFTVSGAGIFSEGTSTVIATTGSGAIWNFVGNAETFNNLTLNTVSSSINLSTATITVNGNLTLTDGAISNGTVNMPTNGTTLSHAATFDGGTAIVNVTGAINNFSFAAAPFTGLTLNNAGVTATAPAGNGLSFGNDVTITAGTFTGGAGNIGIACDGCDLTINGGTFTTPSGTLTLGDDFTISSGTADLDNGTIVGATVSDANWSFASTPVFNNLTFNSGNNSGTNFASATVTVNGNLTLTDGAISNATINMPTNGTTLSHAATFDGGSAIVNVTGAINNFSFAAAPFTGLTLNNAGVTATAPAGNGLSFGNDVTITAGTFTGGAGNIDIACDGCDLTINGGTFTTPSGTLTLGDNFTISSGTVDLDNGTIVASTVSGADWNFASTPVFNNLTFNNPGGSLTSLTNDTITVNGNLTLTDGQVGNGTINMPTNGTTLTHAATFDAASISGGAAIINITGDINDLTLAAAPMLGIILNNAGVTITAPATNGLSFRNDVTITAGTFTGGAGNIGVDCDGCDLTINGGTFTAPSGTLTLVDGFILTSGTFNHNSGTIVADTASGAIWDNTLGATFNNLTFNNDATQVTNLSGTTFNIASTGTLTLTQGIVNNGTLSTQGNVSYGVNFDGGTAALTFTGSSAQTYTAASGATELSGTITINKTSITDTVTLASSLDASEGTGQDLIITSGTLVAAGNHIFVDDLFTISNNGVLEVRGSETILVPTGDFGTTTGLVRYVGDNDGSPDTFTITSLNSGGTNYFNLTLASTDTGANADTFQFALPNTAIVNTIAGAFTISSGIFSGNARPTTVTGLTTVSSGGTYQASTATQTFNGGLTVSGGTFTASSGTVTSNGTLTLSSGTFTGSTGDVDVNGDLTISGGTFTAPSSPTGDLSVSGNWTQSVTADLDNGTVLLDGGNATINVPTSVTFNNLQINSTGTKTISAGDTLTVNGSFVFTDGAINTGDINVQGTISHAATSDGGTGTINVLGTAGPSFNLVAGGILPNIVLNSTTLSMNAPAAGTTTIGSLNAQDGIVNLAAGGNITITNNYDHSGDNLNITAGTLSVGNNYNLSGTGAVTLTAGTVNITNDFNLSGTSSFGATAGTVTVGNDFNQTGGTWSGSAGSTAFQVTNGDFIMSAGTFTQGSATIGIQNSGVGDFRISGTANFTGGSQQIDIEGSFIQTGGTFTGGTDNLEIFTNFSLTGGTFTAPTFNAGTAEGLISVERDFTINGGTFNHNNSVVAASGTTANDQLFTTNGAILYGFATNNTGGSDVTFAAGTHDLNGFLWLLQGHLDLSVNNPNITLAGDLTWDSGLGATITRGTGNITLDGTTTSIIALDGQNIGSIVIDGTNKTAQLANDDIVGIAVGGNSNFTTVTINTADDTWDLNGFNTTTTTLINNGTLQMQGGETVVITNMDTDSGLTRYVGNADGGPNTFDIKNFGGVGGDYFNLTINSTDANDTFQLVSSNAINGTFTLTSGTYNANGNTTDIDGVATINGGTYLANTATQTFGDGIGSDSLTISNTGTFTGSSGAITVNGDFTHSSSQLLTLSSGNTHVSGNFTLSGGTLNHNNGLVNFIGTGTQSIDLGGRTLDDISVTGGGTAQLLGDLNADGFSLTEGTYDANGFESNFSATVTVSFLAGRDATYIVGTGDQTFGNSLQVGLSAAATGTFTGGAGNVYVTNSVIIGTGGVLTGSSAGVDFNLGGNWSNAGVFNDNGGTITFNDVAGTQTITTGGTGATQDFFNLTHSGASTLQIITNDLVVNGTIANSAGIFDGNGRAVTAGTAGSGGIAVSGGTYTSGSGTLDIDGDLNVTNAGIFTAPPTGTTFTIEDDWTIAGTATFTHNGGTVTFDGAGTQNITSGGDSFNAVIISGGGTAVAQDAIDMDGAFTVGAGNSIYNANGQTTNVDGLTVVTSGTYQASTSTQTLGGGLTVQGGGVFTGSTGAVDVNADVNINGGTLTAPSGTFTVFDDWSMTAGIFNRGTGTVTFDGTSLVDPQLIDMLSVFHGVSHTGPSTLRINSNSLTATGDFLNSSGTFDANGFQTSVFGTATVSGGEYQAKTATQTFGDGGAADGLTVNGGTFTGSTGNVDINGIFNLSAGTVTAPAAAATFTISDDFLVSGGTFTANGGEVTLDTPATTATVDAPAGGLSFFDFTIVAGKTVLFTAGDTFNITSPTTWDVQGTAGNLITLGSTTPGTQWIVNPAGWTVDFVNVSDSNNISPVGIINPTNSIDGGNTTRWFPSSPNPPVDPPPVDRSPNCAEDGSCPDEEPPMIYEEKRVAEEEYSTTVFVCEGKVDVNGEMVQTKERALVGKDGVARLVANAIYVGTVEGVRVLRADHHDMIKGFSTNERPSAIATGKDSAAVYALLPESEKIYSIGSNTISHQTSNDIHGLGQGASDMVLSPDGALGYVSNSGSDNVQVFNLQTKEVVNTFQTGSQPIQMALTSDGKSLFVVNQLDKTVSKIDTQTGKQETAFQAGSNPYGLAISADNKEIYVTDVNENAVHIYNADNYQKMGDIKVGENPHGIKMDKDGKMLFVSNRGSNSMSMIDTAQHKEVANILVGEKPVGIAVTPEGSQVYVANMVSGDLSLVDVDGQKVIKSIPVGTGPTQVAFSTPQSPTWCVEMLQNKTKV